MTLTLLPTAERTPQPWKNGGGLTWPLAVSPEGADLSSFDWRLSLAVVEAGGPFSAFPGVDRLMLMLDGRLELDIAGSDSLALDETGEAVAFPGDAVATARLPNGPAADLNLMVRRGRFTGVLERRSVTTQAAIICQDVTFVLSRAGGLTATLGTEHCGLSPGDAARVDHARGGLLRLRAETPDEVIVAHVNAVR
jgi:environmental stress-induced protein Ves